MDFILKIILIVLIILVLILAIWLIIRSQRRGESKRRLLALYARRNNKPDVEAYKFSGAYYTKDGDKDVDEEITKYVDGYISTVTVV